MAVFGTLTDDFDDGVRDAVLWSGSYGNVIESGGRARVPCTTGYAAYQSASSYTLAESQVACRVYAPAVGGALTEALAELLVVTAVGGTDGGFSINMVTGQIKCLSRVGYADGSEVVLTYDASAHAWLRLREAGGSLYWDTSADGASWTTHRIAASPVWVSDANLSVALAGHRDSGASDYSEFDDFNMLRSARLVPASPAAPALTPMDRSASTMSGG